MNAMTPVEAMNAWRSDAAMFEARGVIMPDVKTYTPEGFGSRFDLAMDAQPALTTTPNAGIPAFLTTMIDPQVFEILFSPVKGAEIVPEVKKGTWLDETAMFPTVESTGEVTSYGDFAETGHTGVNTMWPQRQAYLFQTVKEYGEREIERAGLGRINWVSEIDKAAALVLNKFRDLTYHFGVAGMQNYGLVNDPALNAAIVPGTKAAGGVKWILNNAINATANEIYADIQALYSQLVAQTNGVVDGILDAETAMVLVLSPQVSVALTATNSFGVNVADLLKKNFPKLKVVTDVRYGALTAANPQGIAAGNLMQLIAPSVGGQDSGWVAYNEMMRTHPIIRQLSSFKQKVTAGTWGAVIRQPFAFAQMIGL